MRCWAPLVLLLVLVLPIASSAFAETFAETFEQEFDAALEGRVPALVQLGTWCQEHKLYASRNAIAREILEVDDGHVQAHRWLKHKLGPGGKWVEPDRRRPARDHDPAMAKLLGAKREELLTDVASNAFAVVQAHAEELASGRREAALQTLVALAPDLEDVRIAHDDVRGPDGWELAETYVARDTSRRIRDAIQTAKDALDDPAKAPVPSSVSELGPRWLGAWQTDEVLVAATTTRTEAERTARMCEVVPDTMRAALATEFRVPPTFAVYQLGSRQQAAQIMDGHRDATDRDRENWKDFGCWWIGRTEQLAIYASDPGMRLEMAVSGLVKRALRITHGLQGARQPWAMSGFETRLTYEIVGTRKTVTRRISEYADEARERAKFGRTSDNWFIAGADLLERTPPGDFVESLGREMNLRTSEDALIAYALASYFLDGRPDQASELLKRVAKGEGTPDVIEELTGLDAEALRLRLIVWCRERAAF